MEGNSDRVEGERLLGIAVKFLETRDLSSSRDFAVLAQETAPLLDGSDQILAISDVLLAAEKRINNHPNWYSILQLDGRSDDLDSLKKQYRRLALLLHPDKNGYPFANDAFQLVSDAWAILSDGTKKSIFDNEYTIYSRVELANLKKQKQSRQPSAADAATARSSSQPRRLSSFWTACPYCYNLYEYPRVYQDCCLKCNNCNRAMHATEISTLPPVVQGKDAYYCTWGFFPMGFSGKNDGGGGGGGSARKDSGFPNSAPSMFGNMFGDANGVAQNEDFVDDSAGNGNPSGNVTPVYRNADVNASGNVTPVHRNANVNASGDVTPVHRNVVISPFTGAKKRGRPRKNL